MGSKREKNEISFLFVYEVNGVKWLLEWGKRISFIARDCHLGVVVFLRLKKK